MDRYADGYPSDITTQTTSSNWTLQAQQYVLNGYFTRLSVTSVQFFWNLPTIVGGYNNHFPFEFSDIGYTDIFIPTGWYTATTLGAAIVAWSNGTGPGDAPLSGFSCVVNSITGVMTFKYGSAFFIPKATAASSAGGSRQIAPLVFGRAQQTAGIIPGTAAPVSGGYAISGTVPTMLPTRFINIESKYLTKYQRVKDSSTLTSGQSTNILCRVNAFAPSTRTPWPATGTVTDTPFVVAIDFATIKLINWSPSEIISNFDISLTDEYGTLVPWAPSYGCEYSLTLIASET
jgi:hypothetical protein